MGRRADPARPGGKPPATRRLLTDAQRVAWLRLIRTENVGPATFRDLVNHFGGAEAAVAALPELSRRGGRQNPIRICPLKDAEAELSRADAIGATLLALGEPGYPRWLAQVDAPPPLLYGRGKPEISDGPAIAIVGARNGSAIGQKFTRLLAAGLGQAGFAIVSGLARGIDTAAHVASLETGTIAVLAGGIDNIYPPENAQLHAAIGQRGLLLSERQPGFVPRGQDFPRRNRLISGIAAGVIVVEAAERSGSLITARLAGEQGREVFAVPGSPLDPRAAGTNALIKQGATLITCVDDVIAALEPALGQVAKPSTEFLCDPTPAASAPAEVGGGARARILEALGPSPVDIDEVIRATGLSAREVNIVLLELDLAGRLERHGRQLVSLREGSYLPQSEIT